MEEIKALIGRLKAIITEIESVMGKPNKMSKDEYLKKNEDERAEYDKEQMNKDVKVEEDDASDE